MTMTSAQDRERADWSLLVNIPWQMIDEYGEPQFYLCGWLPKWAARLIWRHLIRVQFVKVGARKSDD